MQGTSEKLPEQRQPDADANAEILVNSNLKLMHEMAQRFHNAWIPGPGGHLDASLDVSTLLDHDILCAPCRLCSLNTPVLPRCCTYILLYLHDCLTSPHARKRLQQWTVLCDGDHLPGRRALTHWWRALLW